MLRRRLISAAVLLMAVFSSIYLDVAWPLLGQRGGWLLPMYFFFGVGTAREMAGLAAMRWNVRANWIVAYSILASTISVFPVAYSSILQKDYPLDCPVGRLGWIVVGFIVASLVAGIVSIRSFPAGTSADLEAQSRIALEWMIAMTIVAYAIGGVSVWWGIRMTGSSAYGMCLLIASAATIKFADVGAYFVGKMAGKTKLAPIVSPGKTIEGLFGGLLFAVVVSYVAFRVVFPALGFETGPYIWGPFLFATLLTIVGLIGDLIESMIKRAVGAKDSGRSLPGLGGVWDVTDSLLPTSIVALLGVLAHLT